MHDNTGLSDCFARVAAELSAILIQDTNTPDNDRRRVKEPAVRSRDALEAYLLEMRTSEGQSSQTASRAHSWSQHRAAKRKNPHR
jgi:hypothetical protein